MSEKRIYHIYNLYYKFYLKYILKILYLFVFYFIFFDNYFKSIRNRYKINKRVFEYIRFYFRASPEYHDLDYFYHDTAWDIWHQKRVFIYFIRRIKSKSLSLKEASYIILQFLYRNFLSLNKYKFYIKKIKQLNKYLDKKVYIYIKKYLNTLLFVYKNELNYLINLNKFYLTKKMKIIIAPALFIYYPINSSIFSIIFRITGLISALILQFYIISLELFNESFLIITILSFLVIYIILLIHFFYSLVMHYIFINIKFGLKNHYHILLTKMEF